MDLNAAQKDAVRAWVADGASLSEVQKRLQEEFGVRMTFMDVRLMVLDIGAEIKDKPEPRKAPAPAAGPDAAGEGGAPAPDDIAPEADDGGAIGGVSVEMDRVVQPGMLVSGSATFSDGVTARWGIDQMGRVAFQPSQEGYRPQDDDLREFQMQLRALLERQGYA